MKIQSKTQTKRIYVVDNIIDSVIESSYMYPKICTQLFEVKFNRGDNECKQSHISKFG